MDVGVARPQVAQQAGARAVAEGIRPACGRHVARRGGGIGTQPEHQRAAHVGEACPQMQRGRLCEAVGATATAAAAAAASTASAAAAATVQPARQRRPLLVQRLRDVSAGALRLLLGQVRPRVRQDVRHRQPATDRDLDERGVVGRLDGAEQLALDERLMFRRVVPRAVAVEGESRLLLVVVRITDQLPPLRLPGQPVGVAEVVFEARVVEGDVAEAAHAAAELVQAASSRQRVTGTPQVCKHAQLRRR
eukprot:scaffold9486_cov67-Phaeocystis_antarctica.AAC.2